LDGDGCCPAGCDSTTDNDCCTPLTCTDYPGQCGATLDNGCSGTIDCSSACTAPQICCGGACDNPTCSNNTDCDDGDSSNIDICNSRGTCAANCYNSADGCGLLNNPFKIGIVHVGAKVPLQDNAVNEFISFMDTRSGLNLSYEITTHPFVAPYDENNTGCSWLQYNTYIENNFDMNLIPNNCQVILFLWECDGVYNVCRGGGAFGADWGIKNAATASMPTGGCDVFWFDAPAHGFNMHGAQIMVHEVRNTISWYYNNHYLPKGYPALPDTYAGYCDSFATLKDCYISWYGGEMQVAINACTDGDGCCPAGCAGIDSDCVAACPDGACDVAGGECATCAADCACLNLGDSGCDLTFKSVCCDNATTENAAGEICDVADGNLANMDLNGKTCNYFGYTGGTLGCRWDCFNYDPSSCTGVPATCGNNVCDPGENCLNCPTECCPAGCPDFCFSEGYECGMQTLCGMPADCGSCVLPATCNASGQCVAPSLSVSIQSPINGLEFTSGDLVDFNGFVLGGALDYTYEWSSDNEAFPLSNERVFSSRNLSVNTHTITLKVTDGNTDVAQDSVNITVKPAGDLTVRMILGESGEQTEFFQGSGYLFGSSIVSGGTGAYSYQWNSDLAGDFSTDKLLILDFSTVPAWALGAHTITLTVTDGAGNTAQDTKIINVVNQTLLNILPNNGDHFIVGESVLFAVWRTIGYNLVSARNFHISKE